MTKVDPFSDEQARSLINLEQAYQVWMAAEQTLFSLPYDLRRKEVGDRSYLYQINDRGGNGRSLGPWSPENEARFDAYRQDKAALKSRREVSRERVAEAGRLCRALRLPFLASPAGEILREADRRQLLRNQIMVVGTNAMPAYAAEAAGFIRDAPEETDDFDLAWSSTTPAEDTDRSLWDMLKAVDPTYTVNTERTFQARNAKAYEVEILVAPSREANLSRMDRPKPTALPEQEWLLNGTPVDRVVVCRDGSPARIVAPDPRWFALHKLWMSQQKKRNPLKRGKDERQGRALLHAIDLTMPQYPLDDDFAASLPDELTPFYQAFELQRPERPTSWR